MASNEERAQRRLASLISVFQQGLGSDPLLDSILAGARGASIRDVIDPDEIFAGAEDQVNAVFGRRQRDSLQTLAALGIGGGATSAQSAFFNRVLEREKIRTLGGIRGFLDSAAIQQNPLLALQGAQEQSGTVLTKEALRVENL